MPFDPEKPAITSGVRLGSPAGTTRGFGVAEFQQVGDLIVEVLDGLAANGDGGNAEVEAQVNARQVRDFARASRSTGLTTRVTMKQGRTVADALPLLRQRRHPGEGLAADRRQLRDPPAPLAARSAAGASPPSSACSCAS